MDSMAERLERWSLHTGDPRSNPGETKNFFSDFKNCFMVHEFYKNPTVGFLEFYFTKYDLPRSPEGYHHQSGSTRVWSSSGRSQSSSSLSCGTKMYTERQLTTKGVVVDEDSGWHLAQSG